MYSIVRFVQKSSRLRISSLRLIKVEGGGGGGGTVTVCIVFIGLTEHL